MVALGLTLQPEDEYLDQLEELLRTGVDYYEVAPETTWYTDEAGELHDNGFHRRFAALSAKTGKPMVAHGVGLSMGTDSQEDEQRQRRWLSRVAADHQRFRFLWYTDHLGASSLAGQNLGLHMPLPMTPYGVSVVQRRLRAMAEVVPLCGVENSVFYFLLGQPLEEAGFLTQIVAEEDRFLLLDLHNLYTMAQNFGFDPMAYLERLDLRKVIEIHLSGGKDSDGFWLPSRRVMRLDSHDAAVPDEVFALCEQVLPRCPSLRGVTLERMEGTVGSAEVPLLREELRRARSLIERLT
jgi:uncharacterized protein (UPF0276 family)